MKKLIISLHFPCFDVPVKCHKPISITLHRFLSYPEFLSWFLMKDLSSSFCYLTFRKPQWSKTVQQLHTQFNFHYREMVRQEYCNMFKNIKIKICLKLFSILFNYVLTSYINMARKGLTVTSYALFIFPDWRMRSLHSISPVLCQGFLVAINNSSIITSNSYLFFPWHSVPLGTVRLGFLKSLL